MSHEIETLRLLLGAESAHQIGREALEGQTESVAHFGTFAAFRSENMLG